MRREEIVTLAPSKGPFWLAFEPLLLRTWNPPLHSRNERKCRYGPNPKYNRLVQGLFPPPLPQTRTTSPETKFRPYRADPVSFAFLGNFKYKIPLFSFSLTVGPPPRTKCIVVVSFEWFWTSPPPFPALWIPRPVV